MSTHSGKCYCGNVKVTVKGEPVVAGYCHCNSCRKWHSAPINAWAAWVQDDVLIEGEIIASAHNSESARISCANCGGNVANGKPTKGLMVVYPMTLTESDLKFEPAFHIFHEERVIDMADGLPKFVDAPKEAGFSGVLDQEPEVTGWRS